MFSHVYKNFVVIKPQVAQSYLRKCFERIAEEVSRSYGIFGLGRPKNELPAPRRFHPLTLATGQDMSDGL